MKHPRGFCESVPCLADGTLFSSEILRVITFVKLVPFLIRVGTEHAFKSQGIIVLVEQVVSSFIRRESEASRIEDLFPWFILCGPWSGCQGKLEAFDPLQSP